MALNDITVERTRGTAPLGPARAPFIPRRDRREEFSKIFAFTEMTKLHQRRLTPKITSQETSFSNGIVCELGTK